jgi:signal peptidase I
MPSPTSRKSRQGALLWRHLLWCQSIPSLAFSSKTIRTVYPTTLIVSPVTTLVNPIRTLSTTLLHSADGFSVDSSLEGLYPLPCQRFNVTLGPYPELLSYSKGQYQASEPFTATSLDGSRHTFRVLVYPRGGGHIGKNKPIFGDGKDPGRTSGFGMSYKVLPIFGATQERVGVYLQYQAEDSSDVIDATFDLRLKGQQKLGRMFDVEWSAGMRFKKEGQLMEGTASDFGAHIMQTSLLEEFMGDSPLRVEIRLTLHPTLRRGIQTKIDAKNEGGIISFPDIRQLGGQMHVHDTEQVRVGKVVVPILQKLRQRDQMFEEGAYPGVEYRILRIFSKDGYEVFGSEPGAEYELKPIYPLVDQLERQWPVRVKEGTIPKLLTPNMYNTLSALGSLFTAVFGLFVTFVVSQLVSIFFIPSRSMDPTLQVGDVLVVEKISPRIRKGNNHKGDVVLFHPPSRLQQVVAGSGGRVTNRDLFVKRVAAEPGDIVKVDASGNVKINGQLPKDRRDRCEAEPLKLIENYVKVGETTVGKREVFVLGDCSSVSVDSRVWGSLSTDDIVGKPLFRAWPLDRFGSIAALPTKLPEREYKE